MGLISQSMAKYPNQSATLIIIDPHAQEKDSMTLYIWEEFLIRQVEDFIPVRKYTEVNNSNKFQFKITSLKEVVYFSLCKGKTDRGFPMPLLEYYIIEPGDSIVLEFGEYVPVIQKRGSITNRQVGWIVNNVTFLGRGSSKLKCKFECNLTHKYSGSILELQNFQLLDSVTKVRLNIVNKYRSELTETAYRLLQVDAVGRLFQSRGIENLGNELLEPYLSLLRNIPEILKIRSKEYFESEFVKLKAKYPSLLPSEIYWEVKKDFTGDLRNKLLTALLLYKYSSLNNGEVLVNDALKEINTAFLRRILFDLSEYLSEGSQAYNFSLSDPNGNLVKLSDLKGKIVVMDFWYNKCGACKDYYIYQLSKVEEKYENDPEVVFVAINIDKDRKLWIDGINDGKHTSPKVINLSTGELGPEHPVIKHYKVIGYPRPMVIDKEGKIYKANGKDLRDADKLCIIIESAKRKSV